jgi:hypothetical protein
MRVPAGVLALCGLCLVGVPPAQPAQAQGQGLGADHKPPVAAAADPLAASAVLLDGPHEHGVARLAILVDGDRLDLRLRVPLQTILGVETAPRTEKQRQAVRDMAAKLRDPYSLFLPTAAAGCTAGDVTLRSDALAAELLSASTPPAAAAAISGSGAPAAATRKPTAPAHAELEASTAFRCAKPQALTGLQVRMFDVFPALRQIDAAIVTPRGDSGARLSPNRASLTW